MSDITTAKDTVESAPEVQSAELMVAKYVIDRLAEPFTRTLCGAMALLMCMGIGVFALVALEHLKGSSGPLEWLTVVFSLIAVSNFIGALVPDEGKPRNEARIVVLAISFIVLLITLAATVGGLTSA